MNNKNYIIKIYKEIVGIQSLSLDIKIENDETQIKETSIKLLSEEKESKTFKVNTKRAFKEFPVGSMQMNNSLGAHTLRGLPHFTVDVHEPDIELRVEIRDEGTYIMSEIIYGRGGLPVGIAGKSMVLLAVGID